MNEEGTGNMVLNQTQTRDPPIRQTYCRFVEKRQRQRQRQRQKQRQRHRREEQYGPYPDTGSALLDKHIAAFVERKNREKYKDKYEGSNTVLNHTAFLEKHIAAFMDIKTQTKTKKEGASITVLTQPDTGYTYQTNIQLLLGVHRALWTVVGC